MTILLGGICTRTDQWHRLDCRSADGVWKNAHHLSVCACSPEAVRWAQEHGHCGSVTIIISCIQFSSSSGMPLSLIISQQSENKFCPVLCMSMAGQLTSVGEGGSVPVSLEEALSGRFLITFLHPEATSTEFGQAFLHSLSREGMIRGLFADEVHQVICSEAPTCHTS